MFIQIRSGRISVSHPAAEYVKGSACEYLQKDDHYQDADELVDEETERAELKVSHVFISLK